MRHAVKSASAVRLWDGVNNASRRSTINYQQYVHVAGVPLPTCQKRVVTSVNTQRQVFMSRVSHDCRAETDGLARRPPPGHPRINAAPLHVPICQTRSVSGSQLSSTWHCLRRRPWKTDNVAVSNGWLGGWLSYKLRHDSDIVRLCGHSASLTHLLQQEYHLSGDVLFLFSRAAMCA